MKWPFNAPTRRPRLTLLIAGLVVLLSVLLIARLRPETSLNAMLDPTDPATSAMSRVLEHFPVAEELLVLVSTPEREPTDRDKLLKFADELSNALERDAPNLVGAIRYRPTTQGREFVERHMAPAGLFYLAEDQLAEARRRLSREGMREQFERNAAMLAAPGPAAGAIGKAILQDPLRLHELLQDRLKQLAPPTVGESGAFSSSGRDLLVRVEGKKPLSDLAFSAQLTERVTSAAKRVNQDGLALRFAGGYAIAAHNAKMIRADAIQDSVSSVLVLAAVFWVLYRRPVSTFLVAFIPVACGIVVGFGVYALLRDTITPLAAVIGGALGGIGIDYSTHTLAHHHVGLSPADLTRRMAWPLLAACVTSVIGFAVIGFSPVQLLRDFALVGSLALAGAFVATLTVLPALLTLHTTAAVPRVVLLGSPWARPTRVLGIALLVLVVPGVLASRVNLTRQDPDLHNLHPQPNPPLDAQDDIASRLSLPGGEFVVYVNVDTDEQLLDRCTTVQSLLTTPQAKSAGVKSIFGPASLLPSPEVVRARHDAFTPAETDATLQAFREEAERAGFDPAAFKNYADFLPRLLRPTSAPGVTDLRQYADLSSSVLTRDGDSHEALVHVFFNGPLASREEVSSAIRSLTGVLQGVPGATLTGMSVIGQQTLTAVQRDLPRVALLAAGCVGAYLALHYRSLVLALLAMVPTLVSLILLLAVMWAFDLSLNVVNLVMVPLLLGINIDFGIFAVDTLRDPGEQTLAEHFAASVRAIATCTVTASIGFGSLAFTSVPAVRSLGMLVMVGVVGCALGAVFVLWPIVLMLARRRGLL